MLQPVLGRIAMSETVTDLVRNNPKLAAAAALAATALAGVDTGAILGAVATIGP